MSGPEIIGITIDSKHLIRRVKNAETRLPHAAINAINETALQVQSGEKLNLQERLTIREGTTKQFMLRQAAIIKPFASYKKGIAFAEVAIGQSKGQRRSGSALFLSILERGGRREPYKGSRIAVPVTTRGNTIGARPAFEAPVPKTLWFTRLRLIEKADTSGKKRSRNPAKGRERSTKRRAAPVAFGAADKHGRRKGEQRTFVLPWTTQHPRGGVFQRVGPKRDDIRMLYSFQAPMTLGARLRWLKTARGIVEVYLPDALERQAIIAIEKSGGVGL